MSKKISELQDATTTKGAVVVVVQNGGNFKMPIEDIAKPITYLTDEHLDSIEQEGTYVQMTATKATEDKGYPQKGLCRLSVDVFGAKKIQTLIYMKGDIFYRVFKPNGAVTDWRTKDVEVTSVRSWIVSNEGNINRDPQYYYDNYKRSDKIEESKHNNSIGISGVSEWGYLITRMGDGARGTKHIQQFIGVESSRMLIRNNIDASTWGAWKEVQIAPMA